MDLQQSTFRSSDEEVLFSGNSLFDFFRKKQCDSTSPQIDEQEEEVIVTPSEPIPKKKKLNSIDKPENNNRMHLRKGKNKEIPSFNKLKQIIHKRFQKMRKEESRAKLAEEIIDIEETNSGSETPQGNLTQEIIDLQNFLNEQATQSVNSQNEQIESQPNTCYVIEDDDIMMDDDVEIIDDCTSQQKGFLQNFDLLSVFWTPQKDRVDLLSPQVLSQIDTTTESDELSIISQEEFSITPKVIQSGCCICFEKKDELIRSPCNHRCCKDCWSQWLYTKNVCPFCRAPINFEFLELCGNVHQIN